MRNIWKRFEIDSTTNYHFVLYQSETGEREYGICPSEQADAVSKESDFAAITEILPVDLVLRGDVFSIADSVRLSNGDYFFLDSDAVWYMKEEWDDLVNERKPIRWRRGIPPKRKLRYSID